MTGKAYLVALVMAVLSGLAPVELLGLGTVEVAGLLAGPEKNEGRKTDLTSVQQDTPQRHMPISDSSH